MQVRIVVTDNDGGGIFSFLPQASSLPTARFEQLFGTPHGTDLLEVMSRDGSTRTYTIQATRTVAVTVAASGRRVPPMVVFKGEFIFIVSK